MAATQITEMWNTGDCVRYHAQNTPDKVSTVYEDRVATFADVDRLSNQVANGLLALGIQPADHVGYFGKNTDCFVQLKAGTNKVRGILTPVNWRLAPPEVQYVLDHADVKVLVVSSEYAGLIETIIDKLPLLKTVLVMEEPHGDWEEFAVWRDRQDDTDPGIQCWLEDVDVQLYTSGTTGRPKGVMFSNATSFLGWTGTPPDPDDPELLGTWKEFNPDEAALCIAPNFHLSGNGSIMTSLRMGTTVVIHPEFDIQKVVHDILHYKTSKIFMVPAVLQILLDKAKQGVDLSAIKLLSYGASPIPPETMREAVEFIGCGFLQMYGMTEIGGSATFLEPEDHTLTPTEKMKSAGKPGDFHEIRIVDTTTREELPRRQSGEIAIRTAAP
ncbi:MAG: AMP-binding protein, partial [Proteobacteria bacterium]|nr:AMP-binding protein [Pseudomonadota bacterium]